MRRIIKKGEYTMTPVTSKIYFDFGGPMPLDSNDGTEFRVVVERGIKSETPLTNQSPVGTHEECNGGIKIFLMPSLHTARIVCSNCFTARDIRLAGQTNLMQLFDSILHEAIKRAKGYTPLNPIGFTAPHDKDFDDIDIEPINQAD